MPWRVRRLIAHVHGVITKSENHLNQRPLRTIVPIERQNVVGSRIVATAFAALVLAAGCIGGASAVTGVIKDDGITLATDHAGSNVRFELHNSGTTACDLLVALTSLPISALPVKDGRVVIVDGDGPGIVRPVTTYENAPPYTLGRVEPGADFRAEIALDSTPKSEDRVLLCNGVGDYAHGRFAALRFDR
jgi:hypothetical protein